ncbi:hypothetical protein Tco_1092747 [Tanacetum coccineum]|uniref:Uncharacterized protein n=1 Tax=Tanacetum coccineum TaxID=301880 RepID=A0ABQ5IC03_9ASTR
MKLRQNAVKKPRQNAVKNEILPELLSIKTQYGLQAKRNGGLEQNAVILKQNAEIFQRENSVSNQSVPSFDQLFELNELKAQSQEKDTVIKKLKERIKSLSGKMDKDKIKQDFEEIETINIELDHREKALAITTLKDELRKLKRKALVDNNVSNHPSDPELHQVNVQPITPNLLNKRTAHSAYIKHSQEEAAVLRDLVDHIKANYHSIHSKSAFVQIVLMVKFRNDHVVKIMGLETIRLAIVQFKFLAESTPDSPLSTTVDQQAPSPIAHMGNDPYFGVPIPEVSSDQSLSSDSIHTIKYGFDSCDPVDTPMVEKSKLDEDKEGKVGRPSTTNVVNDWHPPLSTSQRPDYNFLYACVPGDRLVSWSSKRQKSVAISSTEAEYIALSGCCAQILWMRSQLTDYGFGFNKIPMYYDNKSAIALCCNNVQHSRSKHIDINIFTKALGRNRIEFLINKLGMRSFTPETLKQLADEVDE